jgi:energy-coupling factor transporter ATP-binding protein EcfA2
VLEFSPIRPEDLTLYRQRLGSLDPAATGKLSSEQVRLLLNLVLNLTPARDRLAELSEKLIEGLLRARRLFAEKLPAAMAGAIEFFDPERYLNQLSVRDNLVFGRILTQQARAAERLEQIIAVLAEEHGLRRLVLEAGFDYTVGIGGGHLTPTQRQKLVLAAAALRQARVLVVDAPTRDLPRASAAPILAQLLEIYRGRTVVCALDDPSLAYLFERVLTLGQRRLLEEVLTDRGVDQIAIALERLDQAGVLAHRQADRVAEIGTQAQAQIVGDRALDQPRRRGDEGKRAGEVGARQLAEILAVEGEAPGARRLQPAERARERVGRGAVGIDQGDMLPRRAEGSRYRARTSRRTRLRGARPTTRRPCRWRREAWTDGAMRFLKDYVAESQDAASATERAFGQAFSSAEDALTGVSMFAARLLFNRANRPQRTPRDRRCRRPGRDNLTAEAVYLRRALTHARSPRAAGLQNLLATPSRRRADPRRPAAGRGRVKAVSRHRRGQRPP